MVGLGGVASFESLGPHRWHRLAQRIPGLEGKYRARKWMEPMYTDIRPLIRACEESLAYPVEHTQPRAAAEVEMLPQLQGLLYELKDTVEKAMEQRRRRQQAEEGACLYIDLGQLERLRDQLTAKMNQAAGELEQVRRRTKPLTVSWVHYRPERMRIRPTRLWSEPDTAATRWLTDDAPHPLCPRCWRWWAPTALARRCSARPRTSSWGRWSGRRRL